MQRFLHGTAAEWFFTRQQLVQNHAQRKNVAATVQTMAFSANLFGRHIGGCSRDRVLLQIIFFADRQPKVRHIRCVGFVFQQNIGGFDVAMDEPPVVSMLQGERDGDQELRGIPFERATSLDPIFQGGTFNELGDHVDGAILGASQIVDGHDVRMIEAGDHTSFGEVGFGILWFLEPGFGRHFDGDPSVQFFVKPQIDATKRSFTEDSI